MALFLFLDNLRGGGAFMWAHYDSMYITKVSTINLLAPEFYI